MRIFERSHMNLVSAINVYISITIIIIIIIIS